MSNIFQDVLTDVTNVEQNLLGPDYPYWKNIKNPKAIGMSDDGNLSAMARDVNGLLQYVEVLVTGGGASSTGGPLGNKFFLQTGGKCKDVKSGQEVDRFIYINNIPSGNIPFVSAGLDTNFSEFKGLIPGAMSNLNSLNPFAIMSSFTAGSVPECQEITLDVVGPTPPSAGNPLGPNQRGSQTHFVTTVDIKNMDACNWNNRVNPVSGKRCNETFENMNTSPESIKSDSLPEDPIVQFYLACLGLLGIYILYCLTRKTK
jgi:hypothetical protein